MRRLTVTEAAAASVGCCGDERGVRTRTALILEEEPGQEEGDSWEGKDDAVSCCFFTLSRSDVTIDDRPFFYRLGTFLVQRCHGRTLPPASHPLGGIRKAQCALATLYASQLFMQITFVVFFPDCVWPL